MYALIAAGHLGHIYDVTDEFAATIQELTDYAMVAGRGKLFQMSEL